MQVIVNTDSNITLNQQKLDELASVVETSLGHFGAHLTRVEVHLTDESAGRSTGDDISCRLEARPEGRNPEFVTDNASAVDDAVRGALKKMRSVLDSTFGRRDQHKGGTPMGGPEPR
ncbi:MAG: hypothetical protein ACOH10_01765 [Rhodoglobus sp.]